MLWQILDNFEFCGYLYNVQCQLRNAVIIAIILFFRDGDIIFSRTSLLSLTFFVICKQQA